MKLKNKNVLVYGLSLSGEWCAKLLKKYKANVFLYDDDYERLKVKTIKNVYILPKLNKEIISNFDFIVVSPSIEPDNKNLEIARSLYKKIYSEVEFASLFCKKFIAITGTNGKTTTVQLVTAMLNEKYDAIACGNIGYPLSRAVLQNKKYLKVVEVSSFMLENCKSFSPHIATVLNIQPDHLLRHKSIENYKKTKLKIFDNLKPSDYAIINLDNDINTVESCKKITYSINKLADVCVKNGYIYIFNKQFMAIKDLKLKGKHNLYNILCAICCAVIYKVSASKIKEALNNFIVEKYRIESVGNCNQRNFVNDSKSTNIASTLASTETVKGPIILLLGGSNKGLDYKELFTKLTKRVKQIFAFGEITSDLVNANNDKFKLTTCKDMYQAFDMATESSKPQDTILLSPASASYDQFANYIERGKAFDEKVKEYAENFKK